MQYSGENHGKHSKTTIVYHDGSNGEGAGSFFVQGVPIDKKFYLSTSLCIASDKRESLDE